LASHSANSLCETLHVRGREGTMSNLNWICGIAFAFLFMYMIAHWFERLERQQQEYFDILKRMLLEVEKRLEEKINKPKGEE